MKPLSELTRSVGAKYKREIIRQGGQVETMSVEVIKAFRQHATPREGKLRTYPLLQREGDVSYSVKSQN